MSKLYQLPDGWEWKKLGDITELITKGTTPTTNGYKFQNIGINFLKIENIVNGEIDLSTIEMFISEEAHQSQKRSQLQENDVLFSIAGTIGDTAIIKKEHLPMNTNQAIALIRPKEILNSFFLKYSLVSIISQNTKDKQRGGAIKNISLGDIKDLMYPLPPFPEQKRIVSKLDRLFEKIDNSISLHQKNIDEANIFMSSVLNDVFSELEERYGLIKINDIVVKTINKNPLNEKEKPFTYIDISSIDNKLFKIIEPKQLIGKEAPSRAKKEIVFGDILYSTTRPNLKNIAIVNQEYNNPIASTGFCVLRVNSKTINSYLFYYLITGKLFEQIEPNIRGTQYPATSDNDLKNCNIPNTPYETQQKVVTYLDEISQKMDKIKQIQKEKMQNLKALKASILDKAFRGEL